MRVLKFLALGLAGLAGLAVAAFLVAAWIYRDVPADVIAQRYALPDSRYLDIEGVRIHYVDEGSGPAILLLHAHYSSLRMWTPWAEAMRGSHRVVRLDLPSHGLTRPDPTGDYSVERGVHLIEAFTRQIGLEHFALAGASIGATHAIRFAARHPDQVERLILANPGALEGKRATERNQQPGTQATYWVLEHITPRFLSASILNSAFADPAKIPPGLIDEWHDFWMMEGQRRAEIARLSQYRAGDIEEQIRALRMPVLLMWGEANRVARLEQAARMQRLLIHAPSVRLITYPGVGHMLTYEAPERSAADALAYLDTPLERLMTPPGESAT
jgi:pimeloyl-ACP methyl ester carboxylesterase